MRVYRYLSGFFALLFWVLLSGGVNAQSTEAPAPATNLPPDIRLIIDISGSMKRTDPLNLRRPAVKLVTQMLQEGSRAGIWTFGQNVNMLVPHGNVDDAWKTRAVERADAINSVAQFTHIGRALEVASDDFRGDRRFDNTHFILLTDGMVDISKDGDANLRERERILKEVMPRLKARGARIHAVALSDEADRALLQQLAAATDGSFAIAPDAETLAQAFVHAFDSAAPAEQVPLLDNRFGIDGSIEEFTALILRKPESASVRLMRPDGTGFDASRLPNGVRWHSENSFDLITVSAPMPGEWSVEGDLLPQSRVTVVSNLRMRVDGLPRNFFAGDDVDVSVRFLEDDAPLTNADFLQLIQVDLSVTLSDGRSGTKTLSNPARPPEDGVYHDSLSRLQDPGEYRILVKADGRTFQRQFAHTMKLLSPLDVEVQGLGSGTESRYRLIVTPRNPRLNIEQTTVAVRVGAPDGSGALRPVPFDEQNRQWILDVTPTRGDGTYTLGLRAKAVTDKGEQLIAPSEFQAVFPRPGGNNAFVTLEEPPAPAEATPSPEEIISAPETLSAAPEVISEGELAAQLASLEQTEGEPADTAFKLPDWWPWAAGAAGTLVVGGIAGMVWMRRKGKSDDAAIKEPELPPATVPPVPAEPEDAFDAEVLAPVETIPDVAGDEDLDGLTWPDAIEAPAEPAPVDFDEEPDWGALSAQEAVDEPEPEPAPQVEPEPAVAVDDEGIPELNDEDWSTSDEVVAGIDQALTDALGDDDALNQELQETQWPDGAEEVAEEPAPEDLSPEELAERIMAENANYDELGDDEFNLEDFDISDIEELPKTDKKK